MKTESKKSAYRVVPKKRSLAGTKGKKVGLPEYDKDFFKWTKAQANLLKNGRFAELDVDNLREEIISLGRSDKRSLRSYTVVLLTHLLKKKYQVQGQGNSDSWNSSILHASMEIEFLLEDSPSLKNELKKILPQGYERAKEIAATETKLSINTFPQACPWTVEEILSFIKKR